MKGKKCNEQMERMVKDISDLIKVIPDPTSSSDPPRPLDLPAYWDILYDKDVVLTVHNDTDDVQRYAVIKKIDMSNSDLSCLIKKTADFTEGRLFLAEDTRYKLKDISKLTQINYL